MVSYVGRMAYTYHIAHQCYNSHTNALMETYTSWMSQKRKWLYITLTIPKQTHFRENTPATSEKDVGIRSEFHKYIPWIIELWDKYNINDNTNNQTNISHLHLKLMNRWATLQVEE